MCFTFTGLLLLSFASSYALILLSVGCIGIGSSIFHPEASRVAYLASGGKRGLAQSIFQVGGNSGTALGPLLVVLLVIPYGQSNVLWFLILAVVGMFVLSWIAKWYKSHLIFRAKNKNALREYPPRLTKKQIKKSIGILLVLIFSKYIYMTSISSYFTFYLIEKFQLSIRESQYYLFLFFGSVALGTFLGGPLGDRYGRKYIIWFSILGSAPFTLMMPFANLFWTGILDERSYRFYRLYPFFRIFGNFGLCAGIIAGKSWDDLRFIFWICFWNCRIRFCSFRISCRSY